MDETKETSNVPADEVVTPAGEADGYYGEEDMDTEELDLSFLDEEENEDDKASVSK